ncbi:MAG TPA: HD-GYP domain-containing protein [Bacillota bacterium]|jgi:putative nucleotidyltransferase with HDIG domain|nr:HD-GYP domain-containing protein [Bacillota bacterium]HQE65796.1 HD-GYP domain-containing protein [Bacillota bacterium]HQI15336.1 HD-GYP domain-containing protein [Bacillota bacterium]HQJ36397.1 HD-GYP domain-containing protein [Bacillota bacterium]
MPIKLKAYVAIIILLGTAFFVFTLNQAHEVDVVGLIVFTLLSIIAESLVIVTRGQRALSVGFVIALAAIMLFGVPEAAWITSLGIMLRIIRHEGKIFHPFNFPIEKTLFNGANIALSAGLAGLCYEYLGGTPGVIDLNSSIAAIFAAITAMIVYILVNAAIMSILMHLITGENFFSNFLNNIAWVIKDYIAMAPLAILMAIAYISYKIAGILIIFGPLLFARYSFKMYIDMRDIYIDTVKSLSQAVEAKDPYTNGHSRRVGEYACKLAERLGLSPKKVENLKIAAILHDIGKIGIDESILNKPGRLTEEEFEKIKQHPEIGVKIIKDIDFLKDASEIILSHHERYDGTGYPEGRKHKDIILEAQILSIADVFDALTSERPYRNAMTVEEALDIIEKGKGIQFDSKLADAFIKMVKDDKEMKKVAG